MLLLKKWFLHKCHFEKVELCIKDYYYCFFNMQQSYINFVMGKKVAYSGLSALNCSRRFFKKLLLLFLFSLSFFVFSSLVQKDVYAFSIVYDTKEGFGTGGIITTSGAYTIHTFISSNTFVVPPIAINFEVLVVAGGGGGGGNGGGGGGNNTNNNGGNGRGGGKKSSSSSNNNKKAQQHLSPFDAALQGYYSAVSRNGSNRPALFLAVCRGKASEGLDFADARARAVLVFGVPFPSATSSQVVAKKQFNDARAQAYDRGMLPALSSNPAIGE